MGNRASEAKLKIRVFVTLKPDVLDPQGKAIEGALHRLGYSFAHGVRVGKVIELDLDLKDRQEADQQINEMCKKLLSNPVIEDSRYELTD